MTNEPLCGQRADLHWTIQLCCTRSAHHPLDHFDQDAGWTWPRGSQAEQGWEATQPLSMLRTSLFLRVLVQAMTANLRPSHSKAASV